MKTNSKTGLVIIVVGGVGGIQAALDLKDFKVYLVDNQPSIDGKMAQFDKTFPTNDCSICILAPKLVEVGRHKDISIITLSEVEKIEGNPNPGNFSVTLKKTSRYIDEKKALVAVNVKRYDLLKLRMSLMLNFPTEKRYTDYIPRVCQKYLQ